MGKKATLLLGRIIFSGITVLFAILAILGWFSGIVPPQKSLFIALIGLGMAPLMVINFVFLIIWAIKFKWFFVVPLVALLLNINYITAKIQIDWRSEASIPRSDLKVASYNIHGYVHKNFRITLENMLLYFYDKGVDVICMQEFMDLKTFNLDSVSKHYPYSVVYSQRRDMGLAIFSRYPITDSKIIPFPNSANCAMSANINCNGTNIYFVNAHLQTTNINQSQNEITQVKNKGIDSYEGKEAFDLVMDRLSTNAHMRTDQVNLVRSEMDNNKDKLTILCGDFNDNPASYTYHRMKSDLKDSFKTGGSGYAYTFNHIYKIFRLDYIFHSEAIRGLRYESPKAVWSDHNPVLMEFKLN